MIKITLSKEKEAKWPYRLEDEDSPVTMVFNKKELQQLHKKISKILGIVDWKVEMEKDKKKFI